jgi:predicted RNA-binding protein with PIN domain
VWPNLSQAELVGLAEEWAEEHDADVRVVFEAADETADEWLIRESARFKPYWLVTSDRELRKLAGGDAERVIGGGSFARELLKRR